MLSKEKYLDSIGNSSLHPMNSKNKLSHIFNPISHEINLDSKIFTENKDFLITTLKWAWFIKLFAHKKYKDFCS
jgi:hypothetical protein